MSKRIKISEWILIIVWAILGLFFIVEVLYALFIHIWFWWKDKKAKKAKENREIHLEEGATNFAS